MLDQGSIAGAASGNQQGILYTRLSHRHSPLVDFALQSYAYATRLYRELFESGHLSPGDAGELCGNLQLVADKEEYARIARQLASVPELALPVDAAAGKNLVGAPVDMDGFWFPDSGWLSPPAVCRALLTHPLIEVREHCGALTLQQSGDAWQVLHQQQPVAEAPCAIIATGIDAAHAGPCPWLPLQPVRGQTSLLSEAALPGTLRATLCHEGYIAPARGGYCSLGASFLPGADHTEETQEEHRDNLDKLARALPEWAPALQAIEPAELAGRVGVRAASPDYLPLAGPVPARDKFLVMYADLRKNAKQLIPSPGEYLPGLYLSTGHGSRGLTSAPLAAELITSDICHEPVPVRHELSRALAPARFIIRDLCRNRI